MFILDEVFASLPTPPFTVEEKQAVASDVYDHVWQQAVSGEFAMGGVMNRRGCLSGRRWSGQFLSQMVLLVARGTPL